MTGARSFLGIPVEGDYSEASTRVAQRPIEELQPIMQAVLDDPTVVEFGWKQYTPYFNDGDPCEFSVYELWVRTDADTDVEDLYELEAGGSSHPSLGRRPYQWETRECLPYEGPDEARYERVQALCGAIEGGAFENVLMEAFGDHAQVTVRRAGIEVEYHEHD